MAFIAVSFYVTDNAMVWLHVRTKRLYLNGYICIYTMHIRAHSVFLYSIFYFFCIDFGSSCGAISSYRGHLCCSVPWCPMVL